VPKTSAVSLAFQRASLRALGAVAPSTVDRLMQVCSRLIDDADVLVHNLAPGAAERLGFGYEQVSARPPTGWMTV
jgi:CoA-transferase family III